MAEELVSHWEGVSSQGSGHSLGLLGWRCPQGPPVSRSPSPSGEEAPLLSGALLLLKAPPAHAFSPPAWGLLSQVAGSPLRSPMAWNSVFPSQGLSLVHWSLLM